MRKEEKSGSQHLHQMGLKFENSKLPKKQKETAETPLHNKRRKRRVCGLSQDGHSSHAALPTPAPGALLTRHPFLPVSEQGPHSELRLRLLWLGLDTEMKPATPA